MNTRVLKSYTIIPPTLYVERDADRQLARNLSDMGRPAYVLVARQMGKTNLLLNAKRNSANDEAFCYIDASNAIPDLRQFLRNIVDVCIETHQAKFPGLESEIASKRTASEALVEHKEHENELRLLLNHFGGKIVVCLDEIDALTKTSYSDRVFALIRSIYFSGRTNFPEFSRLTYVLSGVAEPTEIIKDRSISPFNIGEKIFLLDFSEIELNDFVDKAGVGLNDDVRRRIYYWTAGNPRMTWDLCAALQEVENVASGNDVDLMVSKLYFQSYDLPPVDHIRSLAETELDIRQALIAIHYGRHAAVSDAMKTKLYLAGITKFDESAGTVQIKNRIIEKAVSEDWLEQIERKGQSQREYGARLLAEGRFSEALESFLAYEKSNSVIDDPARFMHQKGACFYYLEDYEEVIKCFESNSIQKATSTDLYYSELLFLASSYLRTGKADRAATILDRVLSEVSVEFGDIRPIWFYQAALNLAATCFASRPPDYARAAEISNSVLDSLKNAGAEIEAKNKTSFMNSALSNLTVAYDQLDKREDALNCLNLAIGDAAGGDRVSLLLQRAMRFSSREDRRNSLGEAVSAYLSEEIAISSPALDDINAFTLDRAAQLMVELATLNDLSFLDRFLERLVDRAATSPDSLSNVITTAVASAFQSKGRAIGARILSRTCRISMDTLKDEHRHLTALALMFADTDPDGVLEELYFRNYLCSDSSLREHEHRAIFIIVRRNLDQDKRERARSIFEAAEAAVERTLREDPQAFNDIENLAFEYLSLATSPPRADMRTLADDLRRRIERSDLNPSPFYPDGFQAELLRLTARIQAQLPVATVFRQQPKIGRNQIVRIRRLSDGTVLSGKYKRFEDQLREGGAEILVDNEDKR